MNQAMEGRVTYLAFTAMKWYNTMVHMARTPRALAREYSVLWVIMVGWEVRRKNSNLCKREY